MKHIGLFEGIGGFSLAARWMGWETIAWCEWNDYCQKILKQHFKEAKGYGDITKTNFTIYRGKCDIVTGGFPCQPYSEAGLRKGKNDDRHLWPEMLRAIREIQPKWVIGENVSGILTWSKGMVVKEIQTDLENEGFTLLPPINIPACAVNAPHKRERIWFIAYSGNNGFKRGNEELQAKRQYRHDEKDSAAKLWTTLPFQPNDLPAPRITGKDDGLPDRMDRIKALGNAIVPQVAYELFRVIELMEVEMLTCQPGNDMQCSVGENNT